MAKNSASDSKDEKEQSKFKRLSQYVEDSRLELRKVSWPTLKETRSATLMVLGFVTIMAILLGLVDLGLSSLIKTILS